MLARLRRCLLAVSALTAAVAPAFAQQTAGELLDKMTLEQKAGQVFMAWILSRENGQDDAREQLRQLIKGLGLGGVVLSLGSAEEAATLVEDLQSHAVVPLLVAADFEAGVAFRLQGATELGSNMLVGAAGDSRLARAMGRVTATEGKALGFHWAFAPVVDVNVNPRNPIINVRSFGEDPARVARLGSAFVTGLEAAGMLSTAKHFPGHGDVASDSHLEMPTVPGDRARLDRVELVPFRAAVDAGCSSVMTGHLSVPGLGEDPAVPATLSQMILTGVLREEAGFDGIIVTDALDMGGVRQKIAPEEAAVRALAAGADMLLMPPDAYAARDAVVAAVASGRLPLERLDEAVGRLLRAKERVGLLSGGGHVDPSWRDVVGSAGHESVAIEIARRGLTLVRDEQGLLPIPDARRTVLLSILDKNDEETGRDFHDGLQDWGLRDAGLPGGVRSIEWFRLHPESSADEIERAAAAARAADLVIGALHVRVRSYSGVIGSPTALRPVVEALGEVDRAIAVSFGNPYLIEEFPSISTYLCAYNQGQWTEAAAARALCGRLAVMGRLPVSIPGVAARGAGLGFTPGHGLGAARPDEEGFATGLQQQVRALLARAVAQRVFPGAVALVARRGRVVMRTAVGYETYAPDAAPVTTGARFDLASLTKVCATGPMVLRLVARGVLDLDQRVGDLVPEFSGGDKDRVTLRHLMTHSAGLPAYIRFFRTMEGKAAIVAAAAAAELASEPGAKTVYSDLGLILLAACAERAAGEDFDLLCAREVFGPLGMAGAGFSQTGRPLPDAVPTEVCEWRGEVVRGQVHDENAYAMGGVSGHAGLFGTADDVAKIGVAFLGGGRGWLPPVLARRATARAGVVADSSRGLFWDTFVPGKSGGVLLSSDAFGHTGFTGTSIWCDPRRDLCIVLLTNRVHPSRTGGGITGVRGALADLVVRALQH